MNSEVDNRFRFFLAAAVLLAAVIGLRFLGNDSQAEQNWVASEAETQTETQPSLQPRLSLVGVNLVQAEQSIATPAAENWIEQEPTIVATPAATPPQEQVTVASNAEPMAFPATEAPVYPQELQLPQYETTNVAPLGEPAFKPAASTEEAALEQRLAASSNPPQYKTTEANAFNGSEFAAPASTESNANEDQWLTTNKAPATFPSTDAIPYPQATQLHEPNPEFALNTDQHQDQAPSVNSTSSTGFPSTGAALYPQQQQHNALQRDPPAIAQWQATREQDLPIENFPSPVEVEVVDDESLPNVEPPLALALADEQLLNSEISEELSASAIPAEIAIETAVPALPTIKLTDHEISILDLLEPTESTEARQPLGQANARIAALPQSTKSKTDKPKFKKFGATKKDQAKKEAKDEDDDPPSKKSTSLSSSTDWKLAPTPRKGDRYKDDTPLTDRHSAIVEGAHGNFSPTPTAPGFGYDPLAQINVYQGKQLYANQRPLLELGRPWYQLGPISEGSSILGFHNNVNPQYVLFGDARSAIASNNVGGNGDTLIASQINLFHHLKLTSTERFVAGHSPLATGSNNTRFSFDDEELFFEGNANFNFAYFEGDVGALVGGAIGETLPFDLPFAAGIVPLVFQNGIWLEDEILGFALTIPARNSARFDISNMDITFFAGYDRLDSPAFEGDNSAARVFGIATFLDALNGHFEIDYAFLDDRTAADRSYHNIGIGYTRRFGRFLSNSTRVIVNAGQQNGSPGTADGVLLLSENSLITGHPSTVVPYLNFFAGFDRPQSVARNANAGGILRNTGILFESDNLTGYPTLDATANDTFGFAIGLNLLADEFAQQLIVEAAYLGVMGDAPDRNANGDQYGLGVRYQLPLTNSVIVRADAMVGFLRDDEDIRGARLEIRKKF